MKIAVAVASYDINSLVSTIFGRSSSFIIAELENKEIKEISIIKNPAKRKS
jgi:predicted Fe-Mo cluster-binding NifX family protein